MQADIFEQQKQSFFSATAQFYPTPRHVLDRMGIDADNRICYEPSAGKGDIVDYLKEFGAAQVIASEINNDLRAILAAKCTLIGDDFFNVTAEQISHINLIVMNPPFSNAEKHITHAWEIAPRRLRNNSVVQ